MAAARSRPRNFVALVSLTTASTTLAAVGLSEPALAQQTQRPRFYEIRSDVNVDLAITGATGLAWLGSELLKPWLAPSTCRICDRNADGSDALNGLDAGVRSALKGSDTRMANGLSYVIGYAVVPVAALGVSAVASFHDGGAWKTTLTDALIVAETATIAGALDQIVKFSVGRERPFVHVLAPEEKRQTAHPSDNNLSFFSGHTTFAFAVATGAGTMASIRGYRYAPAVWAIGMPLAAATGYLRIAADKHYFSDVLVGAIVGSAVGVAIPLAFHPRTDSGPEFAISVSSSPLVVNFSGFF